ncbi:MAG: FimV/HubP family polar landmark protein [Pseudomonadota bacterium]
MKLHRLTAQLVVGAMLTLPVWVQAAGLGKLTVKSALGQPLSAEIELLVADKSELDSLSASLASGDAYRNANIEFAPVLSALQFSIEKRADGRPVLRLTSSKPVNDPFMDMLIELNWASGRLLREYTILLDPPGIAVPQTVAPVAVSVPTVTVEQPGGPAVGATPAPAAVAPVAAAKPEPAKPAATQPAAVAPAAESLVVVKRGDTLSKIANRVRPANVSLEQALVSLFRENSDAFVGKNMNRLKAGQKLRVPDTQAMLDVDHDDARREISLQAKDWQAYRARLAESVAGQPAQQEAPAKTVVGKVAPKVEDKAQPEANAARDVLKLSKAAPVPPPRAEQSAAEKAAREKALAEQKARAEQEDAAAREKALQESREREAELQKQIGDMQKLAEMKAKEAPAQTPAAAAPEQKPAPAPKVRKAVPPPLEEPAANWYDELIENPIYWTAGAGVVVLGGLLWWMLSGSRLRRKKSSEPAGESIITGGELQPTGVAGAAATGGVVNTGDTSFLTDFSQAGLAEIDTQDVDPIAEADVYMAYGRDAQAEEILKEALKKTPDSHEIRLKLLEIYAARKNVTAFETVAGELYAALGGQTGPVWDRAVEMGRSIDPHNPLYGGGQSGSAGAAEAAPAPAPATSAAPESIPVVSEPEPQPEPEAQPMADISLDFTTEPEPQPEPQAAPLQDLDLSFPVPEEEVKAQTSAPAEARVEEHSLDFDLSGFDLDIPEAPAAEAPVAEAPKVPAMDFSGLDLDLSDMGGGGEDDFDEVATKLDLARAYLEMGDKEGAREILQEVINEGNEKQKSDAQGIMAGL